MSLLRFITSIFKRPAAPAAAEKPAPAAPKAADKPSRAPRGPRRAPAAPEQGRTSGAANRRAPDGARSDRRPRRNKGEERPNRHPEPAPAPQEPFDESKVFAPPVIPESDWDPASFTVPEKEGATRFQAFALPTPILHAISDLGFQYCTPIQAASLARTMQGDNVAGRAQTGTGKTAAFLIAILRRMLDHPETRPNVVGRPAALVLAPTRELVVQIVQDAERLGKYCGLRTLAVFGGCDHERQQRAIREQPLDLIAATPGRLLDFQRSHVLSLKGVHTLVIDEADRMLDMGFIPDVRRIVRALPTDRQTLLFSATLGQEVMDLARQWMPNPVEIAVDPEFCPAETIRQVIFPISSREKFAVLYNILQKHPGERVLVFRNRKHECEELVRELCSREIDAVELSGDVDQKKRLRVIEDFKSGKIKVVVATDVAGRGLQIDDIALVVNYDFPYEADDYIHRIGRTGRAGESGTAVSFACEDESFIIPDIEKLIGHDLPCQMPPEELYAAPPKPTREIAPRKHHEGHGGHRGGGGGGRRPGGPGRRSFPRRPGHGFRG